MSYEEEKQDRKIEQLEIKIEWLQNANTNFVRRICDQAQEIERLRANEITANHRYLDLQYQLDSSEAEKEKRAARIQELEEALVECGSYVGIGPGEGDLPIPERVRRTVNRLNGSIGHYEQRLIAKDARIGPDAKQHDHTVEFFRLNESPAKSWQITDERREALKQAAHICHEVTAFDIAKVLRAMLKEVGQ